MTNWSASEMWIAHYLCGLTIMMNSNGEVRVIAPKAESMTKFEIIDPIGQCFEVTVTKKVEEAP